MDKSFWHNIIIVISAKEKNTASLNLRRRRGRPRKNPILIDDSFRIKTGNNVLERHTGKATGMYNNFLNRFLI